MVWRKLSFWGNLSIGNDDVALILGDNIFYGSHLNETLKSCRNPQGGIVFAYHVSDPERYGVVEFDSELKSIEYRRKAKRT